MTAKTHARSALSDMHLLHDLPIASASRRALYEGLRGRIGSTPLTKYEGPVANGNSILIKEEHSNPFGSHYDRVFIDLFMHHESAGRIKPGDKVLETTSGSAGVSFAGVGRELGYECYVVIPAGGEHRREAAILEQLSDEGHLILTPKADYVNAFPDFLRKFLASHDDFFFINHSMGPRGTVNAVTLRAMKMIGSEIRDAVDIDYFVPMVGNGSSVLGPSLAFDHSTRIMAFEPFQSAVAYALMYPGRYEDVFGIRPGTLSRHRLPGGSFNGIEFPHIAEAVFGNVIREVVLVSDRKTDAEYRAITGKSHTISMPHWDTVLPVQQEGGRTTLAGINVALQLSNFTTGKNLVVIGYDRIDRYDS